MIRDTLDYKFKIALRNYSIVILLIGVVSLVAKASENSNEVLFLKVCIVPLFFLSLGGLRAIYRNPIVEHKITLRAVEYTVLDGLLFALFLFLITWDAEDLVDELLVNLGSFVLVFVVMKLLFLFFDVRRIARDRV